LTIALGERNRSGGLKRFNTGDVQQGGDDQPIGVRVKHSQA
jgi:hypothetical protein